MGAFLGECDGAVEGLDVDELAAMGAAVGAAVCAAVDGLVFLGATAGEGEGTVEGEGTGAFLGECVGADYFTTVLSILNSVLFSQTFL